MVIYKKEIEYLSVLRLAEPDRRRSGDNLVISALRCLEVSCLQPPKMVMPIASTEDFSVCKNGAFDFFQAGPFGFGHEPENK